MLSDKYFNEIMKQKPMLTKKMLSALSSKEAKMRAVCNFSQNEVPIDPKLFEEAVTYLRKKNPSSAAQMCYDAGDQALGDKIYEELSIKLEKKGDLEKAENCARDEKRKEDLRTKIIQKSVDKGKFWEAAKDVDEFDRYDQAIDCYISYDLKHNDVKGISRAADIAKKHSSDQKLWQYFADKCKATGKENIIKAAANKLKENKECKLALELYQIVGDIDNVFDIADSLGEFDVALGAMIQKGNYNWGESYAKKEKLEDKLPDLYEQALNYNKEAERYSTAAGFAEEAWEI